MTSKEIIQEVIKELEWCKKEDTMYEAETNLLLPDMEQVLKDLEKLEKLKNIEEELGCPLEIREKAFKKGYYDINGNYFTCEHYVPYLKQMHTKGIMLHEEKRFKLEDYKKTWWLKKDKSE